MATTIYNVQDYGATGDGTTDDTTAVQATIDAAGVTGGTVFFPAGVYVVTPLQSPCSNMTFEGVNNRASTLLLKAADVATYGDPFAILEVFGTSLAPLKNITLQNLGLNGNKQNMTDPGHVRHVNSELVNFKYTIDVTVDNCYLINSLSEAIDTDYGERGIFTNNHIRDCDGNGIHISEYSKNNLVIGNYVQGCGAFWERSGIDQWETAEDNHYVGNFLKDNYRNLKIHGLRGSAYANRLVGGTVVSDYEAANANKSIIKYRAGTTNSVRGGIVRQAGWGFIQGNGTDTLTTTLTFPEAFDELLGVQLTLAGGVNNVDPTSILSFVDPPSASGQFASSSGATNGSTTVNLKRSIGTWSTTYRYGFMWEAMGRV